MLYWDAMMVLLSYTCVYSRISFPDSNILINCWYKSAVIPSVSLEAITISETPFLLTKARSFFYWLYIMMVTKIDLLSGISTHIADKMCVNIF
jgi:hypothetical protein